MIQNVYFQYYQIKLYNFKTINSDCGPPENVTNGQGYVDTPGGTVYLQVAYYTCIPNFVVIGNLQRTCQPDGTWSGSAPYCGTLQ